MVEGDQVPATWLPRRPGPASRPRRATALLRRGRRRVATARRDVARCSSDPGQSQARIARTRVRSALRSWRSASWMAVTTSSRSVPIHGSASPATRLRYCATLSAIALSSAAVDSVDPPMWANPTGRPGGAASTLRTVITVRDDLRALEGYHSAQVDVEVRLNTNESPVPPPAAFRDDVAAEVSRVVWHRYPDRAATELRGAI